MFSRPVRCGLVAAVLLCSNVASAGAPLSGAESGASVVLVFDASSSMRGRIGKTTKMKLARDVTHDLLNNWDARLNVGLTAYGHRKSKSCDDIEAVVPLGPLDRKAFGAAVDRLKPKGRTPLAAAIQNAAQQLGYTQRKATLIVITDGIENCGGDPCAVAAELEKKGVEFTAHVVGLGNITAEESKQLACIAEKTGGEYRGAKDAPALKAALGGLVQQVEQRSELKPATGVAGGVSLRQLPEETIGNVKMRAVRTPGGVPLNTVWKIWNADKSQQVQLVDRKEEATFSLPPGKYRLVAKAANAQEGGNAEADLPFEVGPGKNHVWELAYNSGRVQFKTFQFDDGPSIQSVFSIQTEAGRAAGGALSRSQPDFELLAGKYELSVTLGNVKLTRAFEVTPGSDHSQNISLNVGKVELRAVEHPGGEALQFTRWGVFSIAADGSVGAVAGSASYTRRPDFILSAGNYVARVKIDGGRQGELRFSVKVGGTTQEEIVVGH